MSTTQVYNAASPQNSRQADDVAVYLRPPSTNPTEAAGLVTAAGIGVLIADSGPLPAGTYFVEIAMGGSGVGAAGKHLQIEHRNAANAATLMAKGICPYGGSTLMVFERVVIALNERIRVVQSGVAGAAGEVAHARVAVYLLAV